VEIESAIHTPVFLGHALDDQVVDIALGRQICTILVGLGMTVVWKEYNDCGHWIKEPNCFDNVVAFLESKVENAD
jgi:predicted esterase